MGGGESLIKMDLQGQKPQVNFLVQIGSRQGRERDAEAPRGGKLRSPPTISLLGNADLVDPRVFPEVNLKLYDKKRFASAADRLRIIPIH